MPSRPGSALRRAARTAMPRAPPSWRAVVFRPVAPAKLRGLTDRAAPDGGEVQDPYQEPRVQGGAVQERGEIGGGEGAAAPQGDLQGRYRVAGGAPQRVGDPERDAEQAGQRPGVRPVPGLAFGDAQDQRADTAPEQHGTDEVGQPAAARATGYHPGADGQRQADRQ